MVVFLECVRWARVSQHASFSLWVREIAFAQALQSRRGFQCLNPQILAMIRWAMMLDHEPLCQAGICVSRTPLLHKDEDPLG